MTHPRRLPRYTLIPHQDATADVETLAIYGPDGVAVHEEAVLGHLLDALADLPL
ncbi:MAG: hypothetical protein ACR2KG_03290 [Nocardioidaceae bacterium]